MKIKWAKSVMDSKIQGAQREKEGPKILESQKKRLSVRLRFNDERLLTFEGKALRWKCAQKRPPWQKCMLDLKRRKIFPRQIIVTLRLDSLRFIFENMPSTSSMVRLKCLLMKVAYYFSAFC